MSIPMTIHIRLALALWAAALLGLLSILPYQLALTGPQLQVAAQTQGMTVTQLLLLSLVQGAALAGVAVFAGAWASRRLGLGAPLLSAWLSGTAPPPGQGRMFAQATMWGLLCAAAVIALDKLFTQAIPELRTLQQNMAQSMPQGLIWQGLLASLYGGIFEEILLRWFALSLFALGLRWLMRKISGRPFTGLPTAAFWMANLSSALLFGLGHLPATAQLLPLSGLIVARALLLNGIVGIAAGCMFRRSGLETAMLLHFSADIGLHVLMPLLGAGR
jgi:hypothetical protein